MGSYFSHLVHEAILSEGDASLKLYGVKLSKKDASTYASKLVEQLGPKLHYLSIDQAKLKAVPIEICNGLTALKHLQLVGNNLSELPPALSSIKTLVHLLLADNEFVRIPPPLMQCHHLRKLDFSNNQLRGLPDNFGDSLGSLEVLRLSSNKLEDSATWPSILKLKRLRELDVSSNLLKYLPANLATSLSALQELNLSQNEISSLEPLSRMGSLRTLLISRLHIDPTAFGSPSHSSANSGGDTSGSTTNSLAGSATRTILTLPRLDVLDMSHNKIISLPSEFFSTLTKLTTLKLHNNRLLRIPKEIGSLSALQNLMLQENQLIKVGKQIAQCTNLEVLHLEFNNLTKLPAAMRSMSKLHCLMLHHNRFKIIPEPLYDATFVSHLYTLSLEANPLTPEILRHIAEKGTREYVLERECRLREEEEAAGKRKGRPSLTRIASQYGSLRGGTTGPPAGASGLAKRPGLSRGTFASSGSLNPGYGTLRAQRPSPEPSAPFPTTGLSSSTGVPMSHQLASLNSITEDTSGSSNATLSSSTPNTGSSSTISTSSAQIVSSGAGTIGPSTPEKGKRSAIPPTLRGLARSPSSSQVTTSGSQRTFSRSKTASSSTIAVPVPLAMGPDGPVMAPSVSNNRKNAGTSRDRALSSPSRVSGNSMSLSQIVKADHTLNEIPPFARFKDAFEHLMQVEDMSEIRREELRKAPIETKWELMRIYKGNLVKLLSNNTARIEREKKFEAWQKVDRKIERLASPQYFISSLKGHHISMPDMNTLKSMFETAPLPWIYEFIDFGGITELARFMTHLLNINRGKDKSAQDIVKETDAISCMSVLATASSSLVLSAPDAIFGVVLSLASDQLAAIKPALKLLVQIHSEHQYTSKVILQSLERAKTILGTPHRFTLFINLLSDLPHLKQDFEVKADILNLISKMCDSLPLIDRYMLRKELNKVGLERALIELNSAPHHGLQQQLAAIEEASFADAEAVKTLAATDYRVLLRIQEEDSFGSESEGSTSLSASTATLGGDSDSNDLSARLKTSRGMNGGASGPGGATGMTGGSMMMGASGSPSLMPPNGLSSNGPMFVDNLKIIVGDLGTNNVRLLPTSTIADIIKKILQRYTIDHPELYRLLFLSSNTAKMEGLWAEDPNALVADFVGKFGGECIASFKMKPLKLLVDCSFAKTAVSTDLEPTWSVQQTIAHIVTTNGFSIDSDYQLSVILDPSERHDADIPDEHSSVSNPSSVRGDKKSNGTPRSDSSSARTKLSTSSPRNASIKSEAQLTPPSSAATAPLPRVDSENQNSEDQIPIIVRSGSAPVIDGSAENSINTNGNDLNRDKSSGSAGGSPKGDSPSRILSKPSNVPSLALPNSENQQQQHATSTSVSSAHQSPIVSPRGSTPRFSVVYAADTNVTTASFSIDALSRSPRASNANSANNTLLSSDVRSESSDSLASSVSLSRNVSSDLASLQEASSDSSTDSTPESSLALAVTGNNGANNSSADAPSQQKSPRTPSSPITKSKSEDSIDKDSSAEEKSNINSKDEGVVEGGAQSVENSKEPSSPTASASGTSESPNSNRNASDGTNGNNDSSTTVPSHQQTDDIVEESEIVSLTTPISPPEIPIPSLFQSAEFAANTATEATSATVLPHTAMTKELRHVILSDSDTLHSLNYSEFSINDLLTGKVMLQLSLKPTKLRIFMGDEGVLMEVDARWSIAELLRHIAQKVPEVQATISDYGIMMETRQRREPSKRKSHSSRRLSSRRMASNTAPGGSHSTAGSSSSSAGGSGSLGSEAASNTPVAMAKAWAAQAASSSEWLSPMRTLAFYDFDSRKHNLRLALRPRELYVILPNGKEVMLSVGFEESVSAVIKLVLVHLDGDTGANYSLFSGKNLLSRRKKLRDVGVIPGDHLILRQEDETVSPTNDEQDMDIWTEPQTEQYLILDPTRAAAAGIPVGIDPNSTQSASLINGLHGSGGIDPSGAGAGAGQGEEKVTEYAPIVSYFSKLSDSAPTRFAHIVNAISLNKIIERLTHPSDMESDFLDIFITTYRSFTTPEQVLSKVMQRYAVPRQVGGHEISDREAEMIRLRCCVFLKEWLDRSFADIDEVLMEKMNIWVENDVAEDRRPLLLNALNKVRTRKLAAPEQISPIMIDIPDSSTNRVSLMDLDHAEIARQLTVYAWATFRAIKPFEFFDCAWSKPKLQHLAPNVLDMIERFNYISNWVASELCMEPKLRVRRTKFVKIVKVANSLREFGNYHMLYAIISGWNSSSVQRLKWTFDKLPRSTKTSISELESLMSMEGSFKNYRDALKRIGNGPCIPYIGILLKDLTFIEDGNPNIVQGLINWYKRRLVHGVIGDYLRSALVPSRFPPVIVNGTPIAVILSQLPNLDENGLYDASLKAEPRGAKSEQLQ